MRKYLLLLLSILSFTTADAQERNPAASRIAFEKIDQVILQFEEWSSFKELGQDTISNHVVNDFVSLFVSGAMIYDGINLEKDSMGFFLFPFVTNQKTVQDYVMQSRKNFPAGFRMNISKSNIDFSEMNAGKVKVIAERMVSGKTNSMSASGMKEYFIQALDTIEIRLSISGSPSIVKISEVIRRGSAIKCPECEKETLDELKRREKNAPKKEKEPDIKEVKPIKPPKPPKPDKVKSPKSFDLVFHPYLGLGTAGVSLNSLTRSNLDATIYTGMINGKSELSGLKTTGVSLAYSGGVNLELMFGKKTQFGLATGFNIQIIGADVTLEKYKVEYRATDASGTAYNRIVTARNVEEKIRIKNTTIPLLARISFGKGNSIHWHLGAGPLLSINSKLTSDATANGNFEAVYHRVQGQFAFDPTGQVEANDWDMTYATVSSRMGDANARTYFENHQAAGFDIAYNKSFSETDREYSYTVSGAWMASLSAGWQLGGKTEMTVGVSYVSSSLSRAGAGKYAMFDKTTDKYKSLMETSSDVGLSSFNLLAGIRFLIAEKNP